MHKEAAAPKNEYLRDLEQEEAAYLGLSTEVREQESKEQMEEEKSGDGDSYEQENPGESVFGQKLYNLDDKVTVWSDFLRPHLHPKSIHLLSKYRHNDESSAFDFYGQGRGVLSDSSQDEEIEDKMHFFSEECDQMQGMNLLMDVDTGFGGFGSSLLERLQDDYSGKGMVVYSVSPATFSDPTPLHEQYRQLNTLLAYSSLSEHCTALIPLSVCKNPWAKSKEHYTYPLINYRPELSYHTSAILGAALDSLTMPCRLDTAAVSMSCMFESLTTYSRKVLGVQTSFPFALEPKENLVDHLMNLDGNMPWYPVSPMLSPSVLPAQQSVVLRGLTKEECKVPVRESTPKFLLECSSARDVLGAYFSELCPQTLSSICTLRNGCKTSTPYPPVFSSKLTTDGHIQQQDRHTNVGVDSVAMMTSLQTTTSSVDHLELLVNQSKKMNLKKFHTFLDAGVEEDEIVEARENLLKLIDNYSED